LIFVFLQEKKNVVEVSDIWQIWKGMTL